MGNNRDSFCVFRWDQSVINFSPASFTTCCRTPKISIPATEIQKEGKNVFLNNSYLIERREEMLNGIRHSDCRECWDIEEQGLPSFRKGPEYYGKTFESFFSETSGFETAESHRPRSLILFIGNTCDLKCVYCGHSLSTSWAAEDLKHGKITRQYYDELTAEVVGFDETFWEFFEEKKLTLQHISFVGGEPLMMKRTFDFLDRIYNAYENVTLKETLVICITSNLNASEKSFLSFLKVIEKFRGINIRIKIDGSIDTIGDKAAYIRTGISWDRWKSNFTRLLELDGNIQLTVIPSLSVLSVSNCYELFTELSELKKKYKKEIQIQENIILTPQYLSPYVLTPEYSNFLIKAADIVRRAGFRTEAGKDYANFLENLAFAIRSGHEGISSPAQRRELYQYLQEIDHRRDSRYREVFPELERFFNLCEYEVYASKIGLLTRNENSLTIPFQGELKGSEAFSDWVKINRPLYKDIILESDDPLSSEEFLPVLKILYQVLDSPSFNFRGERIADEHFESVMDALEIASGHLIIPPIQIPFAGHRDFMTVTQMSHWKTYVARVKRILEKTPVKTLDVKIPVYFYTMLDLKFIIYDLAEIERSTGKKISIFPEQENISDHLSPFIFSIKEIPLIEDTLSFLLTVFPDAEEMKSLLLKSLEIVKNQPSENRRQRARFFAEMDSLETSRSRRLNDYFPELSHL